MREAPKAWHAVCGNDEMSTLVSESRRMAFVHIPKNSGTSISAAIIEALSPETVLDGDGRITKPRPMTYKLGHLNLKALKQNFPDVFAKIESYDTYAVIRDPRARFVSSAAQYFREHRFHAFSKIKGVKRDKGFIFGLPEDVLLEELHSVTTELKKSHDILPYELVHFTKQATYIEHGGRPVVNRAYALGDLGVLSADLSNRYGVRFNIAEKRNATEAYRSRRLGQTARQIGRMLRPIMPHSQFKKLRDTTNRVIKITTDNRRPSAFDHPEVERFVTDYYSRDFELFETVARDGTVGGNAIQQGKIHHAN